MQIKKYKNTRKKTLASGEVKIYPITTTAIIKGPKWTPEQINEMQEMLALGVMKKIICEKFDISFPTLKKYTPVADDIAAIDKFVELTNEINEMLAAGVTKALICERFNISFKTLKKYTRVPVVAN